MRSVLLAVAACWMVLGPAGMASALGGVVHASGLVAVSFRDTFQPDFACDRTAPAALTVDLHRGAGLLLETYPPDLPFLQLNCGLNEFLFDPDLSPVEGMLNGVVEQGSCSGTNFGVVTCSQTWTGAEAYQSTGVSLQADGTFHLTTIWVSTVHMGHYSLKTMDGVLTRV